MTRSGIVFEKIAAFFMLLILPLYVAAVVFDPGFEGQPEYTSGSLSRLLPERSEFRVAVGLMFATALVAFAAAGGLFMRFRSAGQPVVTASALGILTGGFLMLGAVGAGVRIDQLATEWQTLAGPAAAQVERSAVTMGQIRFMTAGLGVVLLLVSLISSGLAIHRMTTLPRWLLRLPVASGLIMLASPLGFVSIGFFAFLGISALVLFVWLLVEAGWLLKHGTGATASGLPPRPATP